MKGNKSSYEELIFNYYGITLFYNYYWRAYIWSTSTSFNTLMRGLVQFIALETTEKTLNLFIGVRHCTLRQ